MIVGFTGTRKRLTMLQRQRLESFIRSIPVDEFHHGMCIGADAVAHELVRTYHPDAVIHGHPCFLSDQQADLEVDVLHPVERPLDRNRNIVAAAGHMVATPAENEEQLRSGTWATIRYTRQAGKPLFLFLPTKGLVVERIMRVVV